MISKLINLIELKDKYACALMDYHLDRIEDDKLSNVLPKLQKNINDMCDNMAKNFIIKYQEQFNDRQIQINMFRYLDNLGVKQGHTGKRFSEALYEQLHIFVQNQEQLNILK